jgi:type IV secretory pathway VirB3-like protein
LDNDLWEDVTNGAVFISDITARVSSLFGITAISVGMVVLMLMVVVVFVVVMTVFVVVIMVVSVVMSVTSQDHKAQQVGEQAGTANNKDKLGIVDFGRVDKACQGFEDDGHAKRD